MWECGLDSSCKDRDQWGVLLNTIMNLRVLRKTNFLTSWATVGLSRKLLSMCLRPRLESGYISIHDTDPFCVWDDCSRTCRECHSSGHKIVYCFVGHFCFYWVVGRSVWVTRTTNDGNDVDHNTHAPWYVSGVASWCPLVPSRPSCSAQLLAESVGQTYLIVPSL